MANLISNQAYTSIQVPTISPVVSGTIIYANQFSGIGQVSMPDDLAEVLNSNIGTVGNNVLVQLNAKMEAYGNGPWYVDSRNGVIYIHNRKFKQEPYCTYIYQAENGEVLRISFTTQRSTKQALMQLGSTIDPVDKQVEVQVSKVNDEPIYDGSKSEDLELDQPLALKNDATFTSDIGTPWFAQQTRAKYDPYTLQKTDDSIKTVDEELEKIKRKNQITTEIQKLKKEYDAKIGPRYTEKYLLEHIPDGALKEQASELLKSSYTTSELNSMNQSIQTLVAGGKDLTSAVQQVFGNTELVFNSEYTEIPMETVVDPREYSSEGMSQEKLKAFDSSRVDSPTELNHEKGKAQEGLNRLKAGEYPGILVKEDSFHEDEYYPRDYNPVRAGTGPADNHGSYRCSVKVFKKVKVPVRVPAWRVLTNLYDRAGGLRDRERAMRINANGGLKVTEKKLICQMQVVGRPALRSSMVIQILNVGKRWSGYWYIKTCTHHMDAGTGYVTDLELIKHTGKAGYQVAGGNINTQDIVANNARTQGFTEIGKDKKGNSSSSTFDLSFTYAEREYFKTLSNKGDLNAQRKFVMDALVYREQNADTPTKGNEGIMETKRVVYQGVEELGQKNSVEIVTRRKEVKYDWETYKRYNFNIDEVIRQLNQDFSNKQQ